MRGATGRLLIRSLLDVRLSRFSMGLLACLSALATVVIISGGQQRTPAQIAALAALREPPMTVVQAVVPRAAVPATPPSAGGSDSASAASGGPDSSDAASSGSSDSSAGSGSSDASAGSSDSSSAGASSDSSDSGSDSSTTSASASAGTGTAAAASTLPKVGHVFEIALSTSSYAAAFGRGSAAPYLRSLTAKGTLLSGYESLGSSELADYLAMVSGQGPNSDTRGGCAKYTEFPQAVVAKANGLVPGKGCVYPEIALTVGDQVSASGHVWKAYIADMGSETCSHPNSNAVDDLALTGTEPGYDTRHNPFIYFHSLLDLGDCASDDVDLSKLPAALAHKARTATLSYIAPGECDDATATASSTGTATDPTSSSATTTTATTPATTTTAAAAPATTTTAAAAPATTTTATATTTGTTATATTTGTTAGATATTTTAGTTTTGTTTTGATTTGTTTTGTTTSTTSAQTPVTADPCVSGQPVAIAAENAFLKLWVPRILASPAYKHNGVLIITFAGAGVKRTGSGVRTGALVLSRYARKGKRIATVYKPYSLLRSVEDMLGYTPLAHAKSAPSFAQAVLHETI